MTGSDSDTLAIVGAIIVWVLFLFTGPGQAILNGVLDFYGTWVP
jgi:hypothetical protein